MEMHGWFDLIFQKQPVFQKAQTLKETVLPVRHPLR